MAASDYATLLTALGPKNTTAFIQALEERGVYVIDSMEDPTDLNADNILSLLFNGVLFWYDPADATTAHDGVSCIVTAEGRRYKSDQFAGVNSKWVPVIDKDLTAPPGAPALDATYIVAAGGTGAWATKDKKFATWTARGWVFLTPKAFDYAYVIDEAQIYHYSAGGAWTSGIPAMTIADNSISLKKLKYFPLGVSVENQTTTAPPGSPADGVAYIVDGTATGAWAGHELDLAIFETSAWIFYDPYEGARIYDKALNATYIFDGSTWETPVTDPEVYLGRLTLAGASVNLTGLGAYKFIRLIGNNIVPVTNSALLRLRISSDGTTYLATGYENRLHKIIAGPTAVYAAGETVAFNFNVGTSNVVAQGATDFEVHLTSFADAQRTKMMGKSVNAGVGGIVYENIHAWQTSILAMQALQFSLSAGNFTQGTVHGWGTP